MITLAIKDDRVLVSAGDYHAVVRLERGRVVAGQSRLPFNHDSVVAAAALAGWQDWERASGLFGPPRPQR